MTRTWSESSYDQPGKGSLSEALAKAALEQLEQSGAYVDFYGAAERQFKLSVGAFEVIEDPSDGYRSCLGTILVSESDETIFFRTPIAQVRLVKDPPTYRPHYDSKEIRNTWSLIDADGHTWLRYGTDNPDDYYPSFVFEYQPKPSQ